MTDDAAATWRAPTRPVTRCVTDDAAADPGPFVSSDRVYVTAAAG